MNNSNVGTRVARGEKFLNILANSGTISDTGRDFLIASLDPMHDTPLKHLEGWPDVESTSSVVSRVTPSLSVKSISGEAYDLHVVVWPNLFGTGFTETIARYNNLVSDIDAVAPPTIGGVQLFQTAVGASLDIKTNSSNAINPDVIYQNGATRLIGMGIEIHDTSSVLNQQGACTVYRQSESTLEPTEVWTLMDKKNGVPGTRAQTTFGVHKIRHPPVSVAEAMLLPGSLQWESKDGCYMVVPFAGSSNPVQLVNYCTPVIENAAQDESMISPNNNNVFIQVFQGNAIATDPYAATPNKIAPIHQIGAKFTGLNKDSTFMVTVHYFFESFPTSDEKQLVVLATPSATFDPVALEIFSRALTDLPTGVPADWNGLGDWFADVISDVGSFATPLLTAFNPALGALAGAATTAANSYKNNPVNKAKQIKKIENVKGKQQVRQSKQELQVRKNTRRKQTPKQKRTPTLNG